MKKTFALVLFLLIFGMLMSYAQEIEWYQITGNWDETDDIITGSGGGNGFYVSNIYITGKKDFEFECDASGEDAFGFGIAFFVDEYSPESHWYCFQVDTKNMIAHGFHIAEAVKKWETASINIEDKESYNIKVTYTAGDETLKFYVDDELVEERTVEGFEGWIGLKTYECTAEFKNIKYTGEEMITPSPTPEETEAPEETETPSKTTPADTKSPVPDEKETEDNVNLPVIIAASIAIVIVAAVVTVLVIKRKG